MSPIAAAKAAVRIEEVVAQYVDLKLRGSRYLGLCPFHEDRNPSFSVFPDSGRYKCFSCGESGDVIDFVARIEGIPVGVAAKRLAGKADPAPAVDRVRLERKRGQKAPADRLDAVYRALLNHLPLSDAHREGLRKRGLTDAAIDRGGYRTLGESGRQAIAAKLQKELGSDALDSVPGFFRGDYGWDINGTPGLVIPVINADGLMVGLQVRVDKVVSGNKYRWISSPGKEGGASSGTPCHVAGSARAGRMLWITEGPLKANIASERLGITCLGIAGVSSWRSALPALKKLAPRTLVLAFDQDDKIEAVRAVTEAVTRLAEAASDLGATIRQAYWDQGKGVDDALALGRTVRVRSYNGLQVPAASVQPVPASRKKGVSL